MKMNKNKKITVFTPTYNRAHTLSRVFDSLINQTMKDFEWLLINDGSTDNTDELVYEFQQKADFKIVYVKQKNKHKFLTIFKALELAKGEYFVSIDSDDSFDFDALDKMLKYWFDSPENTVFLSVLCKDVNGRIVGDSFPYNGFVTSIFDMRYKYKIKGDKWGMTKTEILRKIPVNLNQFKSKGFIPEGVYQFYYDELGTHYGINEALRTYHYDLNDELSLANAYYSDKNAFGLSENYKTFINVYSNRKWRYPIVLFRNLMGYLIYSSKYNKPFSQTIKDIDDSVFKIISIFLYGFYKQIKRIK